VFDKGAFVVRELVNGNMKGQYYGAALEDDLFLVHNVPVNGEGSQILMSHRVTSKGLWQDSKHLGRFAPFGCFPFNIVPITGTHFLLIYRDYCGDLGYREVFGSLVGEFNTLIPACEAGISDLAFLATKFGLHTAYKTENALVYKELGAEGLSQAAPVVFGRDIHSPLLYMCENVLHLMFARHNDVFVCSFNENGISSPQRLKGVRTSALARAQFLQDDNSKESFAANEILVNAQNPWEIHPQFLVFLCGN
jgi:hypothetical protein